MPTINLDDSLKNLAVFVNDKYFDELGDLDLIQIIYKTLVGELRSGKGAFFYYKLALELDIVSSKEEFMTDIHIRNKLKNLLAIISDFEVQNGRPMLSAMVIKHDTHLPGEGFFEWARTLKMLKDQDKKMFWNDQMVKLNECWKK